MDCLENRILEWDIPIFLKRLQSVRDSSYSGNNPYPGCGRTHATAAAVCVECLEYIYRGACSATRSLFPPSHCTKHVFTPALHAALRLGKRRRPQNLPQPSTRSVTSTKAFRRKRGAQSACSLCKALVGPPSQTPSASHLRNLSVLRNPASIPTARRGPCGGRHGASRGS